MKIFKLLIPMLLLGCQTPVILEFEQYKSEIAINCLFTSNEFFTVNVSATKIISGSNDNSYIENATVTIKALKANSLHYLPFQENGNYYDSTFYPVQEESYSLNVDVPGFEIMTAKDSLPSPPIVTDIYCLKTDQLVSDLKGYKITQQFISIYDNGDKRNFYELHGSAYIDFEDRYYGESLTSDDPIITNEKANKYYKGNLIFNDEFFNGDTIQLLCNQESFPPNDSTWHTMITVYSLSEKLYNYRRILRKQRVSSYDILYPVEPIIMSSGIENAYGIFAGYLATDHIVYPSN